MQILLIVIASLGPVIAVIFGCHALWRWAAVAYTPALASALLAVVWLGAASLAAIAALILRARRRRRKAAVAAAAAAAAPASGGLAARLTELPGSLGERAPQALAALELAMTKKPVQTTALLIGAGAMIGRNPSAVIRLARMAAMRA
ncbi:MAG: hypothetical protein ACLFQ5_01870 [Oceanicaulis sp.]